MLASDFSPRYFPEEYRAVGESRCVEMLEALGQQRFCNSLESVLESLSLLIVRNLE